MGFSINAPGSTGTHQGPHHIAHESVPLACECVQDLGLRGSLSNRIQKELTVRLHTVYENGGGRPRGKTFVTGSHRIHT